MVRGTLSPFGRSLQDDVFVKNNLRQRPRTRFQSTPLSKQQYVNSSNSYNRENESPHRNNSLHTQANSSTTATTQYDIGNESTIQKTLHLLRGGLRDQPAAPTVDPDPKRARTIDRHGPILPYVHTRTTQNMMETQTKSTKNNG